MENPKPDIRALFCEALDRKTPEAVARYLDVACGGDAELRSQVEELLALHRDGGNFLGGAPTSRSETFAQSPQESPGTQIGPYKLLQQIGEGGMGVVYMAEQSEPISRRVALKIIKPGMDTRQVIARFEAERQALAMMDHANIARVLDAGTTQSGRPYFVMELVNGVPITKYCDDNRLTPRQRLELFVPVCQAIQHAHQKGIIHRDIKPSNVMVTLYDGQPVPKVIDFGVAKATEQRLTEQTLFTQYGTLVGTLEYMSPEQAEMSALGVDTRSDIYSLGVLLYELLTGSTPLSRKRLNEAAYGEMLRMIKEEEPQKPSTRLSESGAHLASISVQRHTEPAKLSKLMRGELDWIVMKTLEKDRNRRYETASGFAADVQRYLNDEAVQACPPSAGYRFRKFARRNKRTLTMTSIVVLAMLLVVGSLGWSVRDQAAQEQELIRSRVARQTKVASQVQLILDEVERLAQEQRWPEALAVAKRAAAALAGDEADPATRERVRQTLADLEMVARLEEIRLSWGEAGAEGRTIDDAGTVRRYAAAFREYGVDVGALPVDKSAVRLRSHTAIVVPLAAALDNWGGYCRKTRDDSSAKAAWALAGTIDPDRWRLRVRQAVASGDVAALVALTESSDTVQQPPQSQMLLAAGLENGGRRAEAFKVLERASEAHPADFWIHFELSYLNVYVRPKRLEAAVRHGTVARALRPRSSPTWSNLGLALKEQGKLDEAIACYRKAVELDPKHAMAHSNLGNALHDQGKVDEAIACCNKAIQLDPKLALAHNNLGNALHDQGKVDEAIACYRKAIELDPQFATAHSNLGIDLYEQGKLDEAIAAHMKAIELDPKFAGAHTNLGNALCKVGKLDEAIAAHMKAIELDPKIAGAHSNLGNALNEQGKLDEAIAAHMKAIELDPKFAGAHSNLGSALRDQKKLDEAIACYRKAIEFDAKHSNAHNGLGIVLRDQGKVDEAIACYRKAIEFDARNTNAHYNLGNEMYDQAKLDEAIACYRKAIELDPKLAAAHNNLGSALSDQGKLDEAIASYKTAIELAPRSVGAHYNLGLALHEQGKVDEAIACFRKAIELDPKLTRAHTNLGSALREQGELDEAIACYRKVIELDPKSASGHSDLGAALFNQKKLDEAIACYRKAIELDPKYATAHYNLGSALNEQGKLDEAIACFHKAVELNPKYAKAHYGLGIALYRQGKLDEAVASYGKAIELDPKNSEAHNNLAWLLATCADPRFRDPQRALELATKAVELDPRNASYPNTLGVAHYRAGDWKTAITDLEKSMRLREGGAADDWFFLAMAHWQLGEKEEARQWYDRGVAWLDKNKSNAEVVRRFREEAAALMKTLDDPSTKPTSK